MSWISIRRAKELADSKSDEPVSRRQFLRRLKVLNGSAGGKLLRWRGAAGGILEVNCSVLRKLLWDDPEMRERELESVREQITLLDTRTKGLMRRSRSHQTMLKKHERLFGVQKTINEAQNQFNIELLAK